MTDQEKFEGFKKELIQENEEKYGAEVREKWGDEAADASDPEVISWRVDVVVDLGGTFGIADSSSTFTARRVG